jgi:hypothetical protein
MANTQTERQPSAKRIARLRNRAANEDDMGLFESTLYDINKSFADQIRHGMILGAPFALVTGPARLITGAVRKMRAGSARRTLEQMGEPLEAPRAPEPASPRQGVTNRRPRVWGGDGSRAEY